MAGADTRGVVKHPVSHDTAKLVLVKRKDRKTQKTTEVFVSLDDLELAELEEVVERRQIALMETAREAKSTIIRTTERCEEMCQRGSELVEQFHQQERQNS